MNDETLKRKWKELDEKEDGDDIFKEWYEWLDNSGCIQKIYSECHYGDNGVFDAINELIEIINSDKSVTILKDPSYECMSSFGYLVFPRAKT
jgi:hypothetical protein